MDIRRSILKKISKAFNVTFEEKLDHSITNYYQTNFTKTVLISYITLPFRASNNFTHQNYITSFIVAETFKKQGYNVDIVDYADQNLKIDYSKYQVLFGFGYNFEQSFYHLNLNLHRILFVTGAHEELQNIMSLKSVTDFFAISNLWLANEAKVLPNATYYAMHSSNSVVILARDFIFNDFKSRYNGNLYSLNNNILGAFNQFKPKTAETRNNNFLFLSGSKQVTKGFHILMELAKKRKDLNFYVVVPSLDPALEKYYENELYHTEHIQFHKNLRMDSQEMRNVIEECTYILAPSYIDGLPGASIEPMSAGLIPVVSKYCGFDQEEFIFILDELSVEGLEEYVDKVLALTDAKYIDYSNAVKSYTNKYFSTEKVAEEFEEILKADLKD